jgi:hypothetical protein
MNTQDTRPDSAGPPAWFNVDGLIAPESAAELHRLADDVERLGAVFEPLAERCFRALQAADAAASNLPGDTYELLRRWSGMGRLLDALFALANSVDAARIERPDAEPAWWTKVRAELGLNEYGVKVSDER